MSRIRLLVSESWSSIRQNLSTSVAATMTVLIGMCLLGLFLALGTWVLSWSNHLQKELKVNVYFCTTTSMGDCSTNATPAQEHSVGAALRRNPYAESVIYVSKAQGLAQERKAGAFPPGTFRLLSSNPLPDKWVVTTRSASYTPTLGKQICAAHYPGVEPCPASGSSRLGDAGGVQWGSTVTKRVITIGKVISLIFLVAVILLVIASMLLIANTIRLSIFARRREIEVMKLVGATNWFIRLPFMLEGFLVGLAGSLFAVILLLIGKSILLPSVLGHFAGTGSDGVHALPFSINAIVLIGSGLLLGAAGSGLTLRRFLQV
jgi:cell division transport system permease protein